MEDLQASIRRIDLGLLKSSELASKLSESKQYSERKDQKRFKQLSALKKRAEHIKHNAENPGEVEKEVKQEMENSLLRMADKLVAADMKIEEL